MPKAYNFFFRFLLLVLTGILNFFPFLFICFLTLRVTALFFFFGVRFFGSSTLMAALPSIFFLRDSNPCVSGLKSHLRIFLSSLLRTCLSCVSFLLDLLDNWTAFSSLFSSVGCTGDSEEGMLDSSHLFRFLFASSLSYLFGRPLGKSFLTSSQSS